MLKMYRATTSLFAPFIPFWLAYRARAGKEDTLRRTERLGKAGLPRPAGTLLWIHAASVGEANAVLPLIEALLKTYPDMQVLVTTITVTSAALLETRLPSRALHQFAPVDTFHAVATFLAHWQPQVALWVDSELWPNLISLTQQSGAVTGILNARMSERSFRRWRNMPALISELLAGFTFCFPQTETDAFRLAALGVTQMRAPCNLKYDAAVLPVDSAGFERFRRMCGSRPVWLAASTHDGEDAVIAAVHAALKRRRPDIITIIAPRHATRASAIRMLLEAQGLQVAQRSGGEDIRPGTDIYLADTMGELGLFYRAAPFAFIGGTMVAHGGQNPLEAARLGCVPVMGPDVGNFTAIVAALAQDDAVIRVDGETDLLAAVETLLGDGARVAALSAHARHHSASQAGAVGHIMNELQRYLPPVTS